MGTTLQQLLAALDPEQLIATIPSGLFLVDTDQVVVYWNAEAERITGYKAEEVVGRHCSLLEGIECGANCRLFDDRVSKPAVGSVCRVRAKDGRLLFLLKNMDVLRDSDSEIVGGIECFNDVTEQEDEVSSRTAELETERQWLRTVLDTMVDFAYICSSDYTIRYMNRAMIDAFGDHVGEKCFAAFHQEETVCESCPLPTLLAGEVVRQEQNFIDPTKTYEVIHTPLKSPDGSTQKLSVFRDITERKCEQERLESVIRELDAFVYTVSHDLRTPLTPIIGYAEFLADQYADRLDKAALNMLMNIQGQGRRMVSLMEDLLTLSRVGRLQTSAQPVSAAEIVEEVLGELASQIDARGVKICVGELPEFRLPETLLFQVVSNLLGNALRYAGKKDDPIEIGGETIMDGVRLFVRDHGPGIPPDQAEQIFELFYRGETSAETSGTGLGLAIVRKIAHSFDGRVWVEQTPGGGATFLVEFPCPQGKPE